MEEQNQNSMLSDPLRTQLVDAARGVWIRRLMDTTRRNNLLYFRSLQAGTLDLSAAEESAIEDLFSGEKVLLSRLVSPEIDSKAGAKLKNIVRKAQSNLEERGLQTLFLAYGMATWPVADGGRPPEAAIVLLPIAVEGKRTDSDSLRLLAVGSPQVNIALLHALAEDHQLELSDTDLLDSTELEEFVAPQIMEKLAHLAASIRGFEVSSKAVIGNFSFQKLSMIIDLKECAQGFTDHDIIAALSGDERSRQSVGASRAIIDPATLDTIPAEKEFMVLDADSSQQAAVHAVAKDCNGVIQGPPGCGKSQTIANIITTLIATGKRVLFVAEKRAALEAVYKRLEAVGLGHVALDLHGAGISQKAVMQKVSATLELIRHSAVPDNAELHKKFEDRRMRVVAHSRDMHAPVPPSGWSAFELQSRIVEVAAKASSRTRWRAQELASINRETVAEAHDLLTEASAYSSLFLHADSSPWTEASLTDGQAVQNACDAAARLAREHFPEVSRHLEQLSTKAGFPKPNTLGEANDILTLIKDVQAFLGRWQAEALQQGKLSYDLLPLEQGPLPILWATLSNKQFRAAKKRMRDLSKNAAIKPIALLAGAREAEALFTRRTALLGTSAADPSAVNFADAALGALAKVGEDLNVLRHAFPNLHVLPIERLATLCSGLAEDESSAHQIPTVRRIEARLMELGLVRFISEIRDEKPPAQDWKAMFSHAYLSSCYDEARIAMPSVAAFKGETHSQFVDEFRYLDRDRLKVAVESVRRLHAESATAAMEEHPEQASHVRAESLKRSRHMSLRKLVERSADVLTAVCPCWMSSPLNVSQLLPADRQYFDVVVFDEASQVLPEDAVCSILRGAKLVVAGDRHQLPPTSFFADGASEEDEEAPTSGYESLLDQMSTFIQPWSLDWHYRSRDERLIAFSNRHIYGDRLTTFPGIGGIDCISHILVDSVPRDGEEESSSAEVVEVVRLVIEHAEAQLQLEPESRRESLGVITLGIKHAHRIEAALDQALETRRHLADFLDTGKDNPWFFLKNLERVQGDERDAIILSVGYSKDRNGKLPYRFGPLLQQGGERRLNVAVSRARRSIKIVSSFSHADMDPRRSDKKGVELLRLYLQFASSGGTNLGDKGASGIGMNSFEADIFDALQARGIPLIPQYGASGYRLDFAALHPERSGQFVLAIECDGASYHSAPTARDRDRLRQQILEAIGWRFHRIWSTDWFLHREAEMNRAVNAWEQAVKAFDERSVRESKISQNLGGLFDAPVAPEITLSTPKSLNNQISRTTRVPTDSPVEPMGDITYYHDGELDALVRWILSDQLLRTSNDIIDEMMPLLGLRRRGPRILARLQQSIARVNSNSGN